MGFIKANKAVLVAIIAVLTALGVVAEQYGCEPCKVVVAAIIDSVQTPVTPVE